MIRRKTRQTVVLVCLVAVLGVGSALRPAPAGAQGADVAGDPATAPCFAGAPPRTGAPGDGPSPVGRCEPTAGQRLVDNLIWVWLGGLLCVGALCVVRWFRRSDEAAEPGA